MTRLLWVEIPLVLPSTANSREHWRRKARRTAIQRQVVTLSLRAAHLRIFVNACKSSLLIHKAIHMPSPLKHRTVGSAPIPKALLVTLTRVAPRMLDDDNLQGACKGVRDAVAKLLGVGDGPAGPLAWGYAQARGKPALGVEITAIGQGAT